jgi:hypothetical protein
VDWAAARARFEKELLGDRQDKRRNCNIMNPTKSELVINKIKMEDSLNG